MSDRKKISKHLLNILDIARKQAGDVADEVLLSAERIREKFDKQKFEAERRDLFMSLGEQTYLLYKEGRKQAPQLLKETVSRLDKIAGDVISSDNMERLSEGVDNFVKNAVEDFNDFLEEKARDKGQEEAVHAKVAPDKATPAQNTDTEKTVSKTKAKAKTKKTSSNAKTTQKKTASGKKVKATKKTKAKKQKSVLPKDPLLDVMEKPDLNNSDY